MPVAATINDLLERTRQAAENQQRQRDAAQAVAAQVAARKAAAPVPLTANIPPAPGTSAS